MVLPTFSPKQQSNTSLDLPPLIDFDAIGLDIYPADRNQYPTLEGWKTIHAQVQVQLALKSITPGVLPDGFKNKLDTLLYTVSTIYAVGNDRIQAIAKEDPLGNRGRIESQKPAYNTIIANINTAVNILIIDIQNCGNIANKVKDATVIIDILQPLLIKNR